MLGTPRRDPRAPGDTRMYLYFDYSPLGALRWYVKVSRKGRRIGIRERYGTEAFDAAYDAAVAALGGVMCKRRIGRTALNHRRHRNQTRVRHGTLLHCINTRTPACAARLASRTAKSGSRGYAGRG
jgi:hypothetical protein